MVTVVIAGARVTLGSEVFSLTCRVSAGELSHTPSSEIASRTESVRSSLENGPRDCDIAS